MGAKGVWAGRSQLCGGEACRDLGKGGICDGGDACVGQGEG